MSEALQAAWRHGVFIGDAERLGGELVEGPAPPDPELAAFAALAAVREGRLTASREWADLADPGDDGDAAARVLHLAAVAWARAIVSAPVIELDEQRLAAALAALRRTPAGDPVRKRTARAMAELALAECEVATYRVPDARKRWRRVADDPQAPDGPALYARDRLASTVGLDAPAKACGAFESLAADAQRLGRPREALFALRQGSLLALMAGQQRRARSLLERIAAHPDAADAERAYALTFQAIVAGEPGADVDRHLAASIEVTARSGDGGGYVMNHVLASRNALMRGSLEDAVAILTTGAAQLDRAGQEVLAATLRQERERLREEVGEERFDAALDALLAE